MSLSVPLTVTLSTARGIKRITRDVHDLTFRSTSPGGYASAELPLNRPLDVQPDDVAYYGGVKITDGRTGLTVWEGRQEDPSRAAGPGGEVYHLTALGGAAHASDRTVPLVYVDNLPDRYTKTNNSTKWGEAGQDTTPGDAPGVKLAAPRGTAWAINAYVAAHSTLLGDVGMKLARIAYSWYAEGTSASWHIMGLAYTSGTIFADQTLSSAGGSASGVVVTNFANGDNTVHLQFQRQGTAVNPSDDLAWVLFYNVISRALLLDKTGTEITTGYTANTVLASEIVADLCGRLLTDFDGANATIATTSYAIDRFSHPDGANARQILDDLMRLESAYTWHAWERSATTGKHVFEWVAWPTTVTYEASIADGYESTASADGLYNAARVRWRDANGRTRYVRSTSTVAELTAAGLTREIGLDLGDEIGSAANATQVAANFLADHAAAPNGGRLTIARPIRDLVTGKQVMPWEIRPGKLIRVRGILPHADSLNTTTRDGVTVFRVVATEFRASDAAATLELDSYSVSTARALADLAQTSTRRR